MRVKLFDQFRFFFLYSKCQFETENIYFEIIMDILIDFQYKLNHTSHHPTNSWDL